MVKNGKLKMIIIILICVILFGVISENNEKERVRIRVVSNSNSYIDLYYKEEVKDLVCSVVNADDTLKDIENKLVNMNSLVKEYGMNHNLDIKVDLGITSFPPKELDGKIISGGKYQTLLITIGEGKGNNYWTLLYPEYFGITFEEIYSGEIEIRSYFYDVIKKSISN